MEKSPLDDLSFFKFPDLTSDVVQNIAVLFVAIALSVVLTLVAQRLLNRFQSGSQFRRLLQKTARGSGLPSGQKAMLERLLSISSVDSSEKLLADAEAYEDAVRRAADNAPSEQLADLGGLRRVFHLNVMNPALEFVSTRQLLPDLPLRLVATVSGEKLDLYCSLLDIDEQFLYFDFQYDEEIYLLLEQAAQAILIYWREGEGETVFQLLPERVTAEESAAIFRAPHAFRDADIAQRVDFRLSVDLPLRYVYYQREALRKVRLKQPAGAGKQEGEGRLVDLSFGGAAFLAASSLAANGFAQLSFTIQKRPVQLMLEVLSSLSYADGTALVRGRLRGSREEGRAVLNRYLARQQITRLREKGIFRFKAGGKGGPARKR